MSWVRKVIPWVAALSLIGNIYFAQVLWRNATHANHYLWGNMTHYVIVGSTWANTGTDPEARVALATLDLMRSLPRYGQRVGPDDFPAIEHFLRQAAEVRAKAREEHERSGTYTEETARKLAQAEAGFTLLLGHLHRVNDLETEAYALNDGAWRAMWRDIATGLQKVNLD